MKNFKQFVAIVLVGLIFVTSQAQEQRVKNVIILIPDGTCTSVLNLTRWLYGDLTLDNYYCGLSQTYSANAVIGDSAPNGSALANGYKGRVGYVGVASDSVVDHSSYKYDARNDRRPIMSILEAAKLQGKSTGLAVTCYFPHATPAAFSAHFPKRNNYDLISQQIVYNNINVVLGGGMHYLNNREGKLKNVLNERGYSIVENKQALQNYVASSKSGKEHLYGMFGDMDLDYELDRDTNAVPSLAQMTKAAIQLLSKDTAGFVLMVEGSKVDWAAHDNDLAAALSDFAAFDRAVAEAINFAKQDGNTLVISVPDHGTGGIYLGNYTTNTKYSRLTYNEAFSKLAKMPTAVFTARNLALGATADQIKAFIQRHYDIEITEAEAYLLQKINEKRTCQTYDEKFCRAVNKVVYSHTCFSWATHGHTSEDVYVAAYLPEGVKNPFMGLIDNTDINREMQQLLFGRYLSEEYSDKFFVPHTEVFDGLKYTIDNSDKNYPVLTVEKKKKKLVIPSQTNVVYLNGKPIELETVVVYNTEKFYLPQSLRNLLD